PPFSLRALDGGLKDKGLAAKAVGSYQATGGFVMRPWAQANADTVVRYVQAYVEVLRWVLDPANMGDGSGLLADGPKPAHGPAAGWHAIAADPVCGLARDARLDLDGFSNVLKLRAAFEGGTAGTPDKYLDLSYYQRALTGL